MHTNGFGELNHEIMEIELVWRRYLQETHQRVQRVVYNSSGMIEIPRDEYHTYLRLLTRAVQMTNTGQWIAFNRDFCDQMGAAVSTFCDVLEQRTAATLEELERLKAFLLLPGNVEAALRASLENAAAEARARLNKQK